MDRPRGLTFSENLAGRAEPLQRLGRFEELAPPATGTSGGATSSSGRHVVDGRDVT